MGSQRVRHDWMAKHSTCGILVLWPRIKPSPPAEKVQHLNKEVPTRLFQVSTLVPSSLTGIGLILCRLRWHLSPSFMPTIPVLTARWKPVFQSHSIHPWISDILLSNPQQSFVLQIPKSEATLPIWLLLSFKDFFFLNVDHFKSLFWICYNIASVMCFGVLATGDLRSLTKERTAPPALEGEVLTWENMNFRTKWFSIFYFLFIYLFLAMLDLCCCTWTLVAASSGYSFIAEHRLQSVQVSVAAAGPPAKSKMLL